MGNLPLCHCSIAMFVLYTKQHPECKQVVGLREKAMVKYKWAAKATVGLHGDGNEIL